VQLASERTEADRFSVLSSITIAGRRRRGRKRPPGLNLPQAENAWNAATHAVSANPKHLLRQILERLKGADYFGGACKILCENIVPRFLPAREGSLFKDFADSPRELLAPQLGTWDGIFPF
jgi:hypothetical protein